MSSKPNTFFGSKLVLPWQPLSFTLFIAANLHCILFVALPQYLSAHIHITCSVASVLRTESMVSHHQCQLSIRGVLCMELEFTYDRQKVKSFVYYLLFRLDSGQSVVIFKCVAVTWAGWYQNIYFFDTLLGWVLNHFFFHSTK